MRIDDYDELMAASKANKLDPTQTTGTWTSGRRTCPHGGYGLGTECFATRLLDEDPIRNVCFSPRNIYR